MLPGAPGWSCGAPGAIACAAVVTAGRSAYSTSTASAASCACAAVSATIRATGSPHVAPHFRGEREARRRARVGPALPLEGRRRRQRLETRIHQLLAGKD